MSKNIIIGLLLLVPIILIPVVYFQHDRIETFLGQNELETVDWNELNKLDGLYYKKFTEKPFTGVAEGKDETQKSFTTRCPIRGGLKNGKQSTFYANGQLKEKGDFKNGKQEGTWVFYHDNRQLNAKVNFKDGKPDGPYVGYYYSGKLKIQETYKNGELNGPQIFYYKNGQLRGKQNYRNGKREGPWVFFDKKRWSPNEFKSDAGSGTFKDGVKVK